MPVKCHDAHNQNERGRVELKRVRCLGVVVGFFPILLASPATLSDPWLRAVSQHKTNGTNAFQTPALTSNRRTAAPLVVLTCSGWHASLHNGGAGGLPSVRESRSCSLAVKSCQPECAKQQDATVPWSRRLLLWAQQVPFVGVWLAGASPLVAAGVNSMRVRDGGTSQESRRWSPKPGASRVAPCFTAFKNDLTNSNFALKNLKNQKDFLNYLHLKVTKTNLELT